VSKLELNVSVADPQESEFSITLPSGETEKVLELGEFLLFRIANPLLRDEIMPQLRRLHEETGRFVVILFPGQELQSVKLQAE